jgi:hypothetical protein
MRAVIGALLGFAAMLLGALVPILMISGISGMIFGCRVFDGPQLKNDPVTTFVIVSIVIGINVGVWTAFCLFSLPIFAHFGVSIVGKRTGSGKIFAVVRSMKAVALRYASLMDKLIDQEGSTNR